jgi:hypothetical protein
MRSTVIGATGEPPIYARALVPITYKSKRNGGPLAEIPQCKESGIGHAGEDLIPLR